MNEWFFANVEEMSDGEDSWLFPDDRRNAEDHKEKQSISGTARFRMIYGGNALFVFFRIHQASYFYF